MKPFNPESLIVKIVVVVVVGIIISVITYLVVKHLKDKHNQEGQQELSDNLQSDVLANAVKDSIAKKGAVALKKAMDEFETSGRAQDIFTLIKNAPGVTNDDEDAVYSAFAKLRNKNDLAFLSNYFTRKTGKDLFVFLQGFLNASELKKVNDITSKLK